MYKGWTVKLIKKTEGYTFAKGYFPRKFHYKTEAMALVATVKEHGGEAIAVKTEDCSNLKEKRIPRYVFSLSKAKKEILLKALMKRKVLDWE